MISSLAAVFLIVQIRLAGRFEFHDDEALYTSFTRDILKGDIFLSAKGLDKPPVFFYLQALSFFLFGESPLSARLPNVAALMVAFVFCGVLVRRIYSDCSVLYVSLLAAFSPLLILYGPTAFVDPVAMCFSMVSLERLQVRRYFAAGVLGVLAALSKQYFGIFLIFQGALMIFIPSLRPNTEERRSWIKGIFWASIPFLFWATFANTPAWYVLKNTGTTYGRWAEVSVSMGQSILTWSTLYSIVYTVPGALVLLVICIRWDGTEAARWDIAWLAFSIGYFLLIALQVRIPHWNRYILPAAFPVCILAGRGLWLLIRRMPSQIHWAMALGLLFFGVNSVKRVWAAAAPYDFGANYSGNNGLSELFAIAKQTIPHQKAVLLIDFSTFLSRYYARDAHFPILSAEKSEAILDRIKEFPFSHVYLMGRYVLPRSVASIVDVIPITVHGARKLSELRFKTAKQVPLNHPLVKKRLAELGMSYYGEALQGKILISGKAKHHIPFVSECSIRNLQAFCEEGGLCMFHGQVLGCDTSIELKVASKALLENNRKTFRSLELAPGVGSLINVRGELHFLKIPVRASFKVNANNIGLPTWMGQPDETLSSQLGNKFRIHTKR